MKYDNLSFLKMVILLLLLPYSISAQTFCYTSYNYQNNQTLNPFPIIGANSWGYTFGHNNLGDWGYAEKFEISDSFLLTKAYLKFAIAKTNSTGNTIRIKVWNNNGLSFTNSSAGAPGNILADIPVAIDTIPTGGSILTISFPSAVWVDTTFFIGITFDYAVGDTVALYANNTGQTIPGTSWVLMSPSSPPYKWDSYSTYNIENSLFIACELCYVCPTLNLTSTSIDVFSCSGFGEANLNVTNGTPPYQYYLNTGLNIFYNNTGEFTSLIPTVFTAGVIDQKGCTAQTTGTIQYYGSPPPNLYVGSSPSSSSSVADGAAWVNVEGGTPPYTYEWAGGDTNDTLYNLLPLSYSVTVTDANGCSNSTSISVSIATEINNIEDNLKFKVYPMPANNELIYEFNINEKSEENTFIELIDVFGKSALIHKIKPSKIMIGSLNTSNIPNGLYRIIISINNRKIFSKSIVISR